MTEEIKMKTNYSIRFIVIALCVMLIISTVCFAAENKYAANAASWVLDGIAWIAVGIGVWKGGSALLSRNFTAGLGILACVAVIWFLCDDPTIFSRIGNEIKGIIGF